MRTVCRKLVVYPNCSNMNELGDISVGGIKRCKYDRISYLISYLRKSSLKKLKNLKNMRNEMQCIMLYKVAEG